MNATFRIEKRGRKRNWYAQAVKSEPKSFIDLSKSIITVAEAERRILTACRTIRALPDRESKFHWLGTVWPDTVKSTEYAYGYNEAVMPKFRPTPGDVSDCLNALEWARVLHWTDFRLIWWRSFDVSFGQIALRVYKSDETARRWYRDSILRIWHEANRKNAAVSSSVRGRS